MMQQDANEEGCSKKNEQKTHGCLADLASLPEYNGTFGKALQWQHIPDIFVATGSIVIVATKRKSSVMT